MTIYRRADRRLSLTSKRFPGTRRPLGTPGFWLAFWLLAIPGVADAQDGRLTLELSGGVIVPVGDAAIVSGRGPGVAIGLSHRLSDRLSLITEFQEAALTGRGLRVSETTDLNLSRIALGLGVRLQPGDTPWVLASRFGVGLARVGSDPVVSGPGTPFGITRISADVFTFLGGLQIDRRVGRLRPFLRSQVEVYLIGTRLGALRALDDDIGSSGPLIGIPVQLGLKVEL